ncbi:MAG TPA: potassium channel family protein [Acidobacteriaceae bacterium]
MHVLAFPAGVLCILAVLLDAFQTVILPRRPSGRFRLTRLFYLATWHPWRWATRRVRGSRRRETVLSVYGPMSLVFLTAVWAAFLVLGFGLLFYALHSPFSDPLAVRLGERSGSPGSLGADIGRDLLSDIYVSGTTLFTLGLGDVVPHSRWVRALIVLECGTGLAFVAVVIGYFPVFYTAFSRREVNISLLDARAGSPPSSAELLRRHAFEGGPEAMIALLAEWERWAAELLESHISYPLLCYFRSQHTNQSWLGALTAVLDTCALIVSSVGDRTGRQAQLTFAMARHALVDLSQVFMLDPVAPDQDRLPEPSFRHAHDLLCQVGVRVARDDASQTRLREMRALYEPYAECLSRYLLMSLPPFVSQAPSKDNWRSVAKVREQARAAASVLHPHTAPQPAEEEHHIF